MRIAFELAGAPNESLKLVESKSFPNGVMQLRYRRDADA